MKSWAVLAGVLFMGCMEEEIDPSEIPTGIYSLRIDERIETCDPPQLVGELPEVEVHASDTGLLVVSLEGIPGFTSLHRHFLPKAQGYQLTTGRGVELGAICPDGDLTFVTHRKVVSATSGGFVVNEKTDWTVTSPCPEGSTVTPFPQQSCRSDVDQHYGLLEVCAQPCRIRLEYPWPGQLFGDPMCRCPGEPGYEPDLAPGNYRRRGGGAR